MEVGADAEAHFIEPKPNNIRAESGKPKNYHFKFFKRS